MALRDRAQEWLDDYEKTANGAVVNMPSPEVIAAVFAEYLHETSSEDTNERIKALQDEVEELRKKNEELRSHIHMVEREMDRMGGQIAAYKFVIRCNGVSGAEVHT